MSIDDLQAVLVGEGDPEIVSAESRLRVAQLDSDIDELDALIAEDLLFTGPDGNLATKADDLLAYRSGIVRFLSHVPEDLRILKIGNDVAIAALRAKLSVEVAGNVIGGTYRYTRVWARSDGAKWRVVGGHVSEIRPTG